MLLALVLALSLAAPAITGVVRDTSGGAVPGATVTVQTPTGTTQTVTGTDGRFTIATVPEGPATLIVRAGGFGEKRETVPSSGGELEIVLAPAAILESVMVTPTRTEERLGDVPASVSVLDSTEIQQSPAVVADDVLRQVPTFSLFRRSSSLASHPTAQGVSLRGIGPSGVSRTLVLLDSVPFNDPFGGWVYWTRVPLLDVNRIEVVDDTSSSVWGNYAMGGVINIVTAPPTRRTLEIKPQYGNRNSPKLDFFGSDRYGQLGVAVQGSFFDTEGYPVVAASERGAIDIPATVSYKSLSGKLDYTPNDRVGLFLRTGYFSEDRGNGKIQEVNDTRTKFVNGGARVRLPDSSDLQARVLFNTQEFHATFLAVPLTVPPRNSVRLTLEQRVPTKNAGGMVQWSKGLGSSNYLTAGTDWNWVDGDSNEDVYGNPNLTRPTTYRVSGGTQRSFGGFVQDLIQVTPALRFTLSGRIDHWRNYDAHNLETSASTGLPGAGDRPSLPDKNDTVFSPRAAVLYRVSDRVSAWGSLARGFRAPTLNELYRQFRVGSVLTLANEQLGPERLTGGELGVNVAPTSDVTWRTTWFDNRFTDPVSNVTLSSTPTLITRQRQNLGKTRIWGIQTDVEYRPLPDWRISGAYVYDRAAVDENPADPSLVGNLLPQVPRHRGSVQVAYTNARLVGVAVATQFSGAQFDDDQNEFELPAYGVVDVQVTRAIRDDLDVFFGAQNLFNKEFIVGSNPTTIGNPRLLNVGFRLRLSGR